MEPNEDVDKLTDRLDLLFGRGLLLQTPEVVLAFGVFDSVTGQPSLKSTHDVVALCQSREMAFHLSRKREHST